MLLLLEMQLPCQSGVEVFVLFLDAGELNDFSGKTRGAKVVCKIQADVWVVCTGGDENDIELYGIDDG